MAQFIFAPAAGDAATGLLDWTQIDWTSATLTNGGTALTSVSQGPTFTATAKGSTFAPNTVYLIGDEVVDPLGASLDGLDHYTVELLLIVTSPPDTNDPSDLEFTLGLCNAAHTEGAGGGLFYDTAGNVDPSLWDATAGLTQGTPLAGVDRALVRFEFEGFVIKRVMTILSDSAGTTRSPILGKGITETLSSGDVNFTISFRRQAGKASTDTFSLEGWYRVVQGTNKWDP